MLVFGGVVLHNSFIADLISLEVGIGNLLPQIAHVWSEEVHLSSDQFTLWICCFSFGDEMLFPWKLTEYPSKKMLRMEDYSFIYIFLLPRWSLFMWKKMANNFLGS